MIVLKKSQTSMKRTAFIATNQQIKITNFLPI